MSSRLSEKVCIITGHRREHRREHRPQTPRGHSLEKAPWPSDVI